MRTLTLSILAAFTLAACGGEATPKADPPKTEEVKEEKKVEEPKTEEAKAAGITVGQDDGGEYTEITVESDGDQMAYKQKEIKLKADTKTRIIMKNNATMDAMKHNIVIVKSGHEDEVGQAGVGIGEAGNYVPVDNANVLAATEIAAPGETKSVVVSLPAGEYSFICTFPGHYVLMRGKVIVE